MLRFESTWERKLWEAGMTPVSLGAPAPTLPHTERTPPNKSKDEKENNQEHKLWSQTDLG